MGAIVGIEEGWIVGDEVGIGVGKNVGDEVGVTVGVLVGENVGIVVGDILGIVDGTAVGRSVGDAVGEDVGEDVGEGEGTVVGLTDVRGIAVHLSTPAKALLTFRKPETQVHFDEPANDVLFEGQGRQEADLAKEYVLAGQVEQTLAAKAALSIEPKI